MGYYDLKPDFLVVIGCIIGLILFALCMFVVV